MKRKKILDLEKIIEENLSTLNPSITILQNGKTIFEHNSNKVNNSASMGKIFILLHLARLAHEGTLNLQNVVKISEEDYVADSGILQYLSLQELTYNDLAVLVASCSDNTATNVLIRVLGLENIQKEAQSLGYTDTNILDIIRDIRNITIHPEAPSQSTSKEYANLINKLTDRSLNEEISERVTQLLSLNMDMSMVVSSLNIDPLAHFQNDLGFFNKTGTDLGIRCDAGHFNIEGNSIVYSVFINFDESIESNKKGVYNFMNKIGKTILANFKH